MSKRSEDEQRRLEDAIFRIQNGEDRREVATDTGFSYWTLCKEVTKANKRSDTPAANGYQQPKERARPRLRRTPQPSIEKLRQVCEYQRKIIDLLM